MRNVKPAVAAAIIGFVGLSAQAEPMHTQLTAKHTFILGAYNQDADVEVYADVDSDQADRQKLDLGDLGMKETNTSWMAEYRYRLNEKWLFSFGGYTFDTDGSLETKRTFEYDGVEFEAGAKLDTGLQVDTYIADVMYKVYGSDRANLYVGGGLHISNISTDIEAKIVVDDKEVTGSRANDDLTAPLPNLRVQGFYALNSKWALTGTLGWLSLNYEEYEGSFAYIHARVAYKMTERFGLAVGYQYLNMDFSVERDRGEAGIDIDFNGPSVHLSYGF